MTKNGLLLTGFCLVSTPVDAGSEGSEHWLENGV